MEISMTLSSITTFLAGCSSSCRYIWTAKNNQYFARCCAQLRCIVSNVGGSGRELCRLDWEVVAAVWLHLRMRQFISRFQFFKHLVSVLRIK